MRLKDLLKYKDIVIQCHDNPDADALASGFGLYRYFIMNTKQVRFIYRGKNAISKSNLLIMIDELEIPVSYEPNFSDVPDLLITVDCQYGQRNVTKTEAKEIAIIDHHQVTVGLPPKSIVRSDIGSCSTVIWDMLKDEGYPINEDKPLSTALYYGLYSDTNRLSEVSHPLDRDMIDTLTVNNSVIKHMSNSNISLEELEITGKAILEFEYFESDHYLMINAEPCDPNILGLISDFVLETAGVNVCVAYYTSPEEIKFSVRSCVKEVHADELAAFLSKGIGGGGGHMYKAGGTIRPELIKDTDPSGIIRKRMQEYYNSFLIMYAKETHLDTSLMKKYEKLPQQLGAVKLTDIFPEGTHVEIRTLEGDANIKIEKNSCLMIGIEGEIWPIREEELRKSYFSLGSPFTKRFEYEPNIKDMATGTKKQVMKYAKTVFPLGKSRIFAKPLDHAVKLFTAWNEESYYAGNVGDYIAVREDNEHDIYVIQGHLFNSLYKEVED